MIGAVLLQQTHKNTSIRTMSGYKKDRQCRSCNQMKKYTALLLCTFIHLLGIQQLS